MYNSNTIHFLKQNKQKKIRYQKYNYNINRKFKTNQLKWKIKKQSKILKQTYDNFLDSLNYHYSSSNFIGNYEYPKGQNIVQKMGLRILNNDKGIIYGNHIGINPIKQHQKLNCFSSNIVKFEDERCISDTSPTVSFFKRTLNVVGGSTIKFSKLILQFCRNYLIQLGYKVLINRISIHNGVFSGNFGFDIDLDALRNDDQFSCTVYEKFPGLIYVHDKIKVLFFSSGGYIIMPIIKKGDEKIIYNKLYPFVSRYKLDASRVKKSKKNKSTNLCSMLKVFREIDSIMNCENSSNQSKKILPHC